VDANFVREAANVNQEEIALGRLALQHTQDPELKSYAEKLVADHTKADRALSPIAQKNKIQLPSEPGQSAKATQDELSTLTGSEFDRRFIQEMIRGHTQAIAQFERQSSQATDPELKRFIDQTLTDLRDHLRMAQDLQSRPAKPGDRPGEEPGGEPMTPPNGQPGGQPSGGNGGGQPKGR
jgi:putative membrane protein